MIEIKKKKINKTPTPKIKDLIKSNSFLNFF